MNKSTIVIIGLALCVNSAFAACNNNVKPSTPAADFEIKTDGTVVHKTTGLIWKQCSEGLSGTNCEKGTATAFTWAEALNHVDDLNSKSGFAGKTDWRVPNIKELRSIVERSCYQPAINATVFPNTASGSYWSASPDASYYSGAWVVDFYYGNDNSNGKDDTSRVRLVRGL